MQKKLGIALFAVLLIIWPRPSDADLIFMDFEGLTDPENVNNFYSADGVVWTMSTQGENRCFERQPSR